MSNKMLKLLVVCGSLYRRNLLENICSSGSDISLEEDIKLMSSIAERIDVISLEKYNLPKIEFLAPNIYIHRVKYDEVELEIENIYTNLQNNSTDYLITQLLLCDIALQTAKKLRIKTIYYYRSFGSKLPIGIGEEFEPDKIVAVSQYAAKVARKLYKKNVYISYPKFIQPKDSRNVNPVKDKFEYDFMMVNPNAPKGGKIFLEIVDHYPQYKFLAILGWQDLKDETKNFDTKLMELMSKAHGEKEVIIPEEFVINNRTNLTVIDPISNIESYIRSSRAILVPSQWEEAFGRVIVESGLAGRYVIASNQSGIPEAVSIAGMPRKYLNYFLVNDYQNLYAWLKHVDVFMSNYKILPKPKPIIPKSTIEEILYY